MPATLRLTDSGKRRIDQLEQAIARAVARGEERETRRLRPVAAAAAPPPEVEARLLSRGTAEGGSLSGTTLGTPEGGRFMREGMMSVQRAIATDPVVVEKSASRVTARTGNPATINAKTGFFWRTRRRGIQGPTYPFNRAYVEALENGGAFWVVVPRAGTRALEPEPGVIARRVVKTLPPFGMYRQAAMSVRQNLMSRMRQDVKNAARSVPPT